MASDTSRGYETGACDFSQYDGLPTVRVTVAKGRVIIYPMHIYVDDETVTAPEPLACRWIAAGAGVLSAGESLSPRGDAFLVALQTTMTTGNFDPAY